MNKHIISFSLYGSKPMYLNGAIANVCLAANLFPDFLCRFYWDASVPGLFVKQMQQYANVEMIDMTGSNLPKMTWRFLPADDPTVSLFLSRDVDSRLSKREKWVIDDWMNHGKQFLLIKDHPFFYRRFSMMGGLWGMKNEPRIPMEAFIQSWWKQHASSDPERYNDDQIFLTEVIYPLILDKLSYYDDFNVNQLPFCKSIPIKRKNFHFIGEAFDAHNKRMPHYRELRNHYIKLWGKPGELLVKLLYKLNI